MEEKEPRRADATENLNFSRTSIRLAGNASAVEPSLSLSLYIYICDVCMCVRVYIYI